MASDLLSIARSGAKAAQIALDVTSQNISNASTPGYVRRSVQLEEVSATGGTGRSRDVSVSGVRISGIARNADLFRQAEVRRTGADAARADAEVNGLGNVESAVEQSNVYTSIVNFEGALQQLSSDPVDPSLRASVVENARTMASTFNLASTGLDSARDGLQFDAKDGVSQVNTLAGELARVNLQLTRASSSTSDQSTLLDQRDTLLQKISNYVNVSTTINANQTVEVRVGGASGPQLVSGGTASTLAMNTASDGTLSFTLGGGAVTPTAGSIVGNAQALQKLVDVRKGLDDVATGVMQKVNAAQASGVALDGSAGQPLFTGTGAADVALGFSDGKLLATAPAGSGANSRNSGNLDALNSALNTDSPADAMNSVLFDISSTVSGRTVTRDALSSIADNASTALQAQAGVDLDQEAVNLVRYQQAFQASGRVMQVASDIFTTMLNIR